MTQPAKDDVTEWLSRWAQGDREAFDVLAPSIYGELRQIAAAYLRRERPDHTLQPTALVNEAFLRLVEQREVDWQNRQHFFGVSAQLMRRILVDYARQRVADKRGGGRIHVALDDALAVAESSRIDIIMIDDALRGLASIDPNQVRLIELRFFGGLTIEDAAETLGWSTGTAKREWRLARAWLRRELSKGSSA